MAKAIYELNAREIIEEGLFHKAVELMDDYTREEVQTDLAPCTDEEFLAEYMKRHKKKFNTDFFIY